MTPLKYLERLPQPVALLVSVGLVALLGLLHAVSNPALSFHIFYLAPVSLAAWVCGRRAGLAVAAAAAGAWLAADLTAGSEGTTVLIWNVAARFGALGVVGWTITALRRALEDERAIARTDFLTGLHNWRSFAERAEIELQRARRFGRPLTFAYVDLDDFKTVNDRYGHQAGDMLLHTVAATLRSNLRITDLIARLGGDEFAVLLPETAPEPAWIVLRKVHNALRLVMEEAGWPVTTSIGAVTCLAPPATVDELVALADGLMYDVKRVGKNRVHHVVAETADQITDRASA